jgi:CTP:molybdopterin cytidylyltransferase MocA
VIVGVLLAAGASTRMGSSKALVRMGGQSFLVRGVRALWSVCDTVIVVLGANGPAVCRAANEEFAELVAKGLAAPDLRGGPKHRSGELEVRFAFNKRWTDGMLSSARIGLMEALKHKPRGVLLMPVDHPEVMPATVQELGAMLEQALNSFGGKSANGLAYGLVPRHRGLRGHPVALSAALADAVRRDRVARDLSDGIRRNARLVGYLDVADKGIVANHNTPLKAGKG